MFQYFAKSVCLTATRKKLVISFGAKGQRKYVHSVQHTAVQRKDNTKASEDSHKYAEETSFPLFGQIWIWQYQLQCNPHPIL